MLKIEILKNEFGMVLKVAEQYNYHLSLEKKILNHLATKKKILPFKNFHFEQNMRFRR